MIAWQWKNICAAGLLFFLPYATPAMPLSLAKFNAAFSSKVSLPLVGIVTAGFIACYSLTGCSGDYGSSRPVLDVIGEKREGDQDLAVFVDGVWWFGYQGGAVGYLRSDIADESGVVTFRQTLSGLVGENLSDHPDIGAQVWLDHDGYRWWGEIVAVFDTNLNFNAKSDLYQIAVAEWLYLGEGEAVPPAIVPRYMLAYPRGGVDAAGFVFSEKADDAP